MRHVPRLLEERHARAAVADAQPALSGAIACDHTLPPIFYVTTWGGEARLKANARLEQEFFSEPRDADPAPMYTAVPASA